MSQVSVGWTDCGLTKESAVEHRRATTNDKNQKNTESSLAETSPVLSCIDTALAVVLEQHGIGELMLQSGIRNSPILHRLVEVKA